MNASHPVVEIKTPVAAEDLAQLKVVFMEYAESLGIDLAFQAFEEELQDLPGDYAEPRGALLMAWVDGAVAGCCALRPLDTVDYPNASEMKRLYVRPAFRRLGLGRQLAENILDKARTAGYDCVLLDTLSSMESARSLYQDLNFVDIPAYYFNPIEGARYLRVKL